MKIPFAKPDITKGDIQEVDNFLLNCDGQLTQGLQVAKFETTFSGYIRNRNFEGAVINEGCIATSSCMTALHLSYLALGIGPGDEVICPAMSHVATAHAIELVGAKPVFIDSKKDGNIDVRLIQKELETNRNIKAVSLVHYVGNPCNMAAINFLAKEYGVKVVEDCALSLGSRVEKVHTGLLGMCGAFSFYPTKHITTGEGGMFVTKDHDLYRKAKQIASFGKTSGTHADYDIGLLGGNFRMSEIQAVMGLSQLKRLTENLEIRRRNLDILTELSIFIHIDKRVHSIFGGSYCANLRCVGREARNNIRGKLENKGIQTSIYYPHPISRLSYYRNKYGYAPVKYPEAIKIADTTLALPIGPHVTEEMMNYMVKCLKEVL